MGINTPSDEEGTLQIGPTDQGMVRVFAAGASGEVNMDFDPEEAEEIARELIAAAGIARSGKG